MKGHNVETEDGGRKGFPAASTAKRRWRYRSGVDASENLPPELERFWRTDDGLTAIQRAEAYGIDLSLLDENLRLTPAKRLRQNDCILNEADALAAAYQTTRERAHSDHPPAR